MRIALLPALLLILFATSTTQAQTDPYQWGGVTSIAYTGDGNGQGFVGMTTQCRADYGPGARMCKSEEIMDSDTLNLNAIPTAGCWVRPVYQPHQHNGINALDVSGVSRETYAFSSFEMSCVGWRFDGGVGSPGTGGLVLGSDGAFAVGGCEPARPVACCKPTPVPEPTSSLSLPVGLGALAGLAALKGGA